MAEIEGTIVVWFSCGAASAVAAKRTIEKYGGRCTVRVVNTPIREEDEDNRRFLKDVEDWIGQNIEICVNPKRPNSSIIEVFDSRRFMSSPQGAPCTMELKKWARQYWEENNHHDWLVLGFTNEEVSRHNKFKKMERENILPVLIEDDLSKQDCFDIILQAGIEPPRIYKDGYPNANCIGCVKATSPTYWNLVREKHPEVFEQRSVQSREIGTRLVRYKGERIYLDELPPDAKGYSLKSMGFECGIFCEESNG